MPNPRLAARYAKSLLDLAVEKNQLEQVYNDVQYLQQVCSLNRDFVSLLKSPVVHSDKKLSIISAVTQGKVGEITKSFKRLLINKGRESYLPEIIAAFIEQYKVRKGIFTVKLTTAVPVGEEIREAIIQKARQYAPSRTIELKTEVRENIIGGFLLELGNTLVDASIAYDLNKIRSQFYKNDFVYKIR